MTYHLKLLVSFSTLFIVLIGCNLNFNCLSKDSFLSGFDNFINDVEEHYKSLEKTDWADIDSEYRKYLEECYAKHKESLTTSEKVSFWKNALLFGLYRSYNDPEYKLDLEGYGIDLDTEIESLTAAGQEELRLFIKEEVGPELSSLINNVLKELEGLGEQFKSWLEEL